jgi:predicted dithiol-disulfide oxidoreductase (DUF899 family)
VAEGLHDIRFPNETEEYRTARDELLKAEIGLRAQIEDVATMRGKLPVGGNVEEDYAFQEVVDGDTRTTRLSDLFEPGKQTLMIYSFMFGPNDENPCPMCTSFLDGLNGSAPHIRQRISLAVAAKSPAERVTAFADSRGWKNLRIVSSGENTYNLDYHAEDTDGDQLPACNVFVKRGGSIRHFYSAELFYADLDGQPRHVDLMWPLWNAFDLTPEGRGEDWYPEVDYSS